MNIFVTDDSAFKSAANLDDSYVVMQIMDTMRILSAVVEHQHNGIWICQPAPPENVFVRWCRNDKNNLFWLLGYAYGLLAEYEERFKRSHSAQTALDNVMKLYRYIKPDVIEFINCAKIPEKLIDYTHFRDTQWAYRMVLCEIWANKKISKSQKNPRWTGTTPPYWTYHQYDEDSVS